MICYIRLYIGATPSLVITDQELLKQVLVKQFDCFTDRVVSNSHVVTHMYTYGYIVLYFIVMHMCTYDHVHM